MGNNKLRYTIEYVVKNNLCCGCGTCVSICPYEAIKIKIDLKRGIYIPYIEYNKCKKCYLCYKVCPGWEVNFPKYNEMLFPNMMSNAIVGRYYKCYTAYSTINNIRYNSASGGLITGLLIYALEEGLINGALVAKMDEKNPLESKVFIARTKQDIISAACSKYCPVPANIMLKTIMQSNEKYAFVGLPCHVHGLRKAESLFPEIKEKIIFRIGILCAKNISYNGTKYQLNKMHIDEDNVKGISYRGEGWPGYMTIELKNNINKVMEYVPSYYDNRFDAFVMHRCTLCYDGAAELSDASFGDAWLPEIKDNDKLGTSIIIIRNNYMDELLLMAKRKGLFCVNEISVDDINRSQHFFTWKKRELSARFILNKIMGRKLPLYWVKLRKPDLESIKNSLIYASKILLASHKSLWKILDYYGYILARMGGNKNRW
jgi:coenzyme F420 hydrogenase subunit beta